MSGESLNAEIISIGDELTIGKIVDTNSAWLSRQLTDLGVEVLYHSTVGDSMEALVSVLKIACARAEIVLVTGGLGPTEDDLTRQAIAHAAGVELVYDQRSYEHVKTLFQRRGRPMPESNNIQAYFPAGSEVIDNPHGTANGFSLAIPRAPVGGDYAFLIALPGVPAEMREMWNASGVKSVADQIERRIGEKRFILTRSIHCFGPGESLVESKLPHLIDRHHVPRVGITASAGIITLRIRAIADSPRECRRQVDETAKIIYDNLGEVIFGEDDDTIPSVVCAALKSQGKKLATIEWGTRGCLAKAIDPEVFAGGLVASSKQSAAAALGLDEDADFPAILKACAERFGAERVAAVGPYPADGQVDSRAQPQVEVCAWDAEGGFKSQSYVFGLHPSIIDNLFVCRALMLLRE
ncbi:MAG: CinA family nicotinamide mononucleotide deamidase-related protein [Thermoguttaceae bacterium]|nr:CinA family nicotinamide mononucleotide deamidase-related protein [Thermoguttaceae bacterium]